MELTLKNANKIGCDAAKKGAAVEAVFSSTKHIMAVKKGDEEVSDAIFNVAIDTGKAGAKSYINAVSIKAGEGLIKNAGHKLQDIASEKAKNKAIEVIGKKAGTKLVKFAESNELGRVVNVVFEVGQSVKKYLDGEINSLELVDELGEKGTSIAMSIAGGEIGAVIGATAGGLLETAVPGIGNLVGAEIGAFVGEVLGSMAGYIIGTVVYREVCDFFQSNRSSKMANKNGKICIYS